MTGLDRQRMAEMIQRFVAGGDVSVDLEFTQDEVYPIIDSFVTGELSKAVRALGANGKEAINEMWLKKIDCQDIESECDCGEKIFYYDMPVEFLVLPEDSGIFAVRYKDNCRWDMSVRSMVKNANTYLPSIAGIMPQSHYLTGKRIYFTKPAEKITLWYVPIPADLSDTDFMALLPDSEKEFQVFLHDYFAGRGNAPKDRMGNQQDIKQ